MHTNNAHPHPQTETNEHTKSPSKLFNHKQKVAEGMPQGLVFNSISNRGPHPMSRKDFDALIVKLKKKKIESHTQFGTVTKVK